MRKNLTTTGSIEPFFEKIAGLTRLQRILICIVSVAILLAAFGFFLYKPKIDDMASLNSEISRTEKKLERTKASAAEYEEYKEKMDEARLQFDRVSRELPISEEIPSLLTNISQAGNAAGLKFLRFQPQSESKKDFYAEIPIRMELSGSYHQLGNFFDRLARLSRIVNIDNCSTRRQDASLSISCTAVTYRFIGEEESP